ncbi:Asp23/Gls24 family envelope stress response protein [Amycolatopsis sp. NPDC004747]
MTTATTTAPAHSDAGDRGALTIGDTAVERIATTAVTEVDGVGGSATRVLGVAVGSEDPDRSAKVTATVAGDTAALTVRLSISYPRSVLRTTDAVREHLIRRVHELTGLAVERVDITVTALHTAHADTRRVQ